MSDVRLFTDQPLPAICLKCGAPAEDQKKVTFWKSRTLQFDPVWSIVILFCTGIIPALTVEMIVRLSTLKQFQLAVPLCSAHQNYFLMRRLLYGGILFGLALPCSTPLAERGLEAVLSVLLVMCVFLAVVGVVLNLIFRNFGIYPLDVGVNSVKLRGVSEVFAAALEGHPEPPLAQPVEPENPFDFR